MEGSRRTKIRDELNKKIKERRRNKNCIKTKYNHIKIKKCRLEYSRRAKDDRMRKKVREEITRKKNDEKKKKLKNTTTTEESKKQKQ